MSVLLLNGATNRRCAIAFIRFQLDCAIKEEVFATIPQAKKDAFKAAVRALKAYASKINEGLPNEEMTVKASWHRCLHDEGGTCPPEQDI